MWATEQQQWPTPLRVSSTAEGNALATNIGNTNKAVVRDAASLAFSYLPFGQRSNPEPEDDALPSSAATGSSGRPPRTPLTGGRGV